MVFLELPKKLSEEEKILQQKFAKLKRKKKALQALKAPKPEPPPPPSALKRAAEGGSKIDANELAKKLLRTGQISAIKPREIKDDKGFKRSRSLEKKQLGADKPGGYRPYMAQSSEDGDSAPDTPISPIPSRPPYKHNLYENFVSPKEVETMAREETNRDRRRDGKANYVNRDTPDQGKTIYVRAPGINESIVRNSFTDFGTIMHVEVQEQKNCAFVTYETIEEANEAINRMNDATVEGLTLHVSLARRQPNISANRSTEVSYKQAVNSWTKIAGQSKYNSQANETKPTPETRQKIVYDNPFE